MCRRVVRLMHIIHAVLRFTEDKHMKPTEHEIRDFGEVEERYGEPTGFIVLKYFTSGDYVGSTVETSNRRVFEEIFAGRDWWETRYWGYGASGIAVSANVKNEATEEDLEELFGFLFGLEGYPLADEDDHTEVEMELQQENWIDYGTSDFRAELTRVLDEEFEPLVDALPKEALQSVYRMLCKHTDTYPECESAVSTHFYVDRVCEPFEVAPGYCDDDSPVLLGLSKLVINKILSGEPCEPYYRALCRYARLNKTERAVFNDTLYECARENMLETFLAVPARWW